MLVAFFVSSGAAQAANYYIDAVRGNDAWSGRLPDPATTADGPWQSLAKLAGVTLAAGDVVGLRCGSSWSETLRVTRSGSKAQPITFRPYPSPCTTTGPTIDGFTRISGSTWTRSAPNVYSLRFPLNLLPSSGFINGLNAWRIWSPSGDGMLVAPSTCGSDGLACMQITSGRGRQPTVVYGAPFRLAAGAMYRMRFDVKAASGVSVRAYIRRSQAPFDVVGVSTEVKGTGAWQSVSLPFVARAQLEDARLDFDLPAGGLRASVNNVFVEQQVSTPFAAVLGATQLVMAHHPNRGFNAVDPSLALLHNAADADTVAIGGGATGSTYLVLGSDYKLPPGAVLQPGTTVFIRTNAWMVEQRTVAAVAGNRLMLDRPTSFPLKAGWGFYLSGASWMLDESGEWWFDDTNSTVLVRTPTDNLPTVPLALSTLDTCIDLSNVSNVTVEGVTATGCRVGVRATGSVSVVLRGLRLLDSATNGVSAPISTSLQVLDSRIERSGQHAIVGKDESPGIATGMVVSGNTVIDAGVIRVGGKPLTLPVPSLGAIVAGTGSMVLNNTVSGAGYHGIRTYAAGLVKGNMVDNVCLLLDDCAGIYAYGSGSGSRIEANLVRDIPGGMDGKPPGSNSQGQGIFLDDHATGVAVVGNTVVNAENGVLLHNAHLNTVRGNVLYGNRKLQIWLFEDSRLKNPGGDVHGNVISENMFFSTSPVAAVGQQSLIKDTFSFATYDRNRYSALIGSRVVSEDWPTGSNALDFLNWQRAVTQGGAARNLEAGGSVVSTLGYASFKVLGGNIIAGGLSGPGANNWTPWNDRLPLAVTRSVTCGNQNCLEVTAGGSSSLVASPAFSVVGGNWYRASFDLRADIAQSVSTQVRRGGGGNNGYESLMGSAEMASVPTAFKRFSFVFKADKSINAADRVTGDNGARLYFDRIAPGNRLVMGNIEIVPLSTVDATLRSKVFANPSDNAVLTSCPEQTSNPSQCARYVNFATGVPITWPLQLAARASVIGYLRDTSLVDSDGDGISDAQDQCPSTLAGVATDSKGCGI